MLPLVLRGLAIPGMVLGIILEVARCAQCRKPIVADVVVVVVVVKMRNAQDHDRKVILAQNLGQCLDLVVCDRLRGCCCVAVESCQDDCLRFLALDRVLADSTMFAGAAFPLQDAQADFVPVGWIFRVVDCHDYIFLLLRQGSAMP